MHVLSMLSSAVSLFITIMSCDAFTCYMYLRFHFTCDQSVLCFVSLCQCLYDIDDILYYVIGH